MEDVEMGKHGEPPFIDLFLVFKEYGDDKNQKADDDGAEDQGKNAHGLSFRVSTSQAIRRS